MNNPLELIQAMQNPQQFIENAIQDSRMMQNPIFSNAVNLYKSGNTADLQKLVNNVATQKGTSVDNIRKMLGI